MKSSICFIGTWGNVKMSHLNFWSPLLTLSGEEAEDLPRLKTAYDILYPRGGAHTFDGKPVKILNHSSKHWSGYTYFMHHLCTRGHESQKDDRYYCTERSSKMPWSLDLLKNYKNPNVLVWKQVHNYKFRRVFIYAQSCQYLAVLQDNNFDSDPKKKADQYTFVSAYPVTATFEHNKLMDSYRQKKIPSWNPV